MAEKPKIFESGRDMVLSLVVVVVIMVGAVATTGLCSFNPGNPENGPVQEADAASYLSLEARSVDFPVRLPVTPEGWVSNSARRSQIDGGIAPVVGYITADGGYLQLTQTSAPVVDAVSADQKYRELERTEQIAGATASIYSGTDDGVRDLWIVDLGAERIMLTGAATEEDFRTLLDATCSADPLPGATKE